MQVQPYLQFDGRCEEALEFYKTALGAKVEAIMRFRSPIFRCAVRCARGATLARPLLRVARSSAG